MNEHARIVVVGASLGGLRCVEALRRQGHTGPVQLVGAEPSLPYDRPPLSKEVLTGATSIEDIGLTDAGALAELRIDVRLGEAATALDVDDRTVTVGDHDVGWDAMVLATGSLARHLPGTEGIAGVHVIRTDRDVRALAPELVAGARVVVVGAGFIGAEAASSARTIGCEVVVLEAAAAPMSRGLGDEMGAVCGLLHADNGVDLRVGVEVRAVLAGDDGRVAAVELGDGTSLPADVVIVGIGSAPATAWLDGSGLTIDDGVVCDEFLCATEPGEPPVYAIGDVVRWPNAWNGETMRVEHWTNAVETAHAAAKNLLVEPDARTPHSSVPFVWSDQYGHRIQIAGRPHGDDHVEIVAGSVDERAFVAAYRRGDALSGVMAIDMIKPFVTGRRLLMQRVSWSDALAAYAS